MKAGWEVKPLGALCEILDSQRKPITKRDRKPGANPYYGATGIQDFVEGYLFDEPLVLVGEDGAKWASGENTAFAIEGKCWVNNHAHVLRPNRTLLNDNWLIHFLVHSDLSPFVSGLTVPKLNQGNLREIPIPLPPLPEQRRIVALLDEAFAGIATAKANAEKNLQNARALFESHLQSVFTERGEGWVEKSLEDIAVFSQGIQVGLENQSTEMAEGLVRFIRIVDYTQQTKDVRFIQDPGHRYWVTESDIVMVRYGTPGLIGRGIAGVIANNLFKITVSEDVVLKDYLSFFLGQSEIQHHLATQGSSTMPALTFKQLGRVSIAYPLSKLEQEKIVRQITDMLDETVRLESIYQRKLEALDELKQSLLHQAFSGQL